MHEPKGRAFSYKINHVITVGAALPVKLRISLTESAFSAISFNACVGSMLRSSLLYFSRYTLIVAPDEPVPDFLKMNREPSLYRKIHPWLSLKLASTGSMYLKTSATLPSCSALKAPNYSTIRAKTFSAASVSTPS